MRAMRGMAQCSAHLYSHNQSWCVREVAGEFPTGTPTPSPLDTDSPSRSWRQNSIEAMGSEGGPMLQTESPTRAIAVSPSMRSSDHSSNIISSVPSLDTDSTGCPTYQPIFPNRRCHSLENMAAMIELTEEALEGEITPELTEEGTQGTYFVRSVGGERIGVFKPRDEEVCGEANPRGLNSAEAVLKSGIPSGEAWRREIAAYILDRGHFAGVPETFQLNMLNTGKVGSFQRFVKCDGEVWDVLPGRLPKEKVHRIAVLDIRLCNSDRHGGNMLYKKDAEGLITELVPIDHAACCPTNLEDLEFEWLQWPQAREPMSPETLRFVAALDPVEDARVLEEEVGLEGAAADNVRAASTLLQKAAPRGYTLRAIGEMMRRPRIGEPSMLEQLIKDCRQESANRVDFNKLEAALESHLALSP
eukprot:Hpha_TRINITY_DN19705_c0_g1::TRINITY_DN19705_c0_g1_i1::g.21705::m.21705